MYKVIKTITTNTLVFFHLADFLTKSPSYPTSIDVLSPTITPITSFPSTNPTMDGDFVRIFISKETVENLTHSVDLITSQIVTDFFKVSSKDVITDVTYFSTSNQHCLWESFVIFFLSQVIKS